MAEPQQNQQEQKSKFSLFNPGEWGGLIWDRFVRLPLLERLRIGRIKVGGRPHPIEEELRKVWLTKNKTLFDGPLETIEKTWDSQGTLIGFSENKEALILGNPDGIVPLYKSMGPYVDLDRIESEKHWFQFGTGIEEEEVPFEFPDEKVWKEWGWGLDDEHKQNVEKLRFDPSQPWKRYRAKKFKLNPGVVFHEGKQELKEQVYSFGYHKWRKLAPALNTYTSTVVIEDLRRSGLNVFLRTKMSEVLKSLEQLFQAISKIEEGNYKKLSNLKFQIQTYEQLWKKMIEDHTPERKDIIMRFEHSYMIIKIYINEKLEKIKMKKIDEDGEEVEEIIDEVKLVYFDNEKNEFNREFNEIIENIRRMGGEAGIRAQTEQKLNRIRQIRNEITNLNQQIKPLMSTALKQQFKDSLIKNFQHQIYGKEMSDFLKELLKKMAENIHYIKKLDYKLRIDAIFKLIDAALVLKSSYSRKFFDESKKKLLQYYSITEKKLVIGSLIKQFKALLNKLYRDGKMTSSQYRVAYNSFNSMIRDLKILEDLIENNISPRSYEAEIEKLFEFLYQKLSQLGVKINKVSQREIEDLKNTLKQQPYSIAEKRQLMKQAYGILFDRAGGKIINEHLKDKGDKLVGQMTEFLNTFMLKVDELVSIVESSDAEFLAKREDFFDSIIAGFLNQNGIKDENQIKDMQNKLRQGQIDESLIKLNNLFVDIQKNFDNALSAPNLSPLLNAKERLIIEKIALIDERKELLGAIFKKERLKFYVDHLTPKNPRFKPRPEEIFGFGLDENGYPLEIDAVGSITEKKGTILIDYWWNELAQNGWHLRTIASKPGGVDFLKRHLGVTPDTGGRGIRNISFRNQRGTPPKIGTPPDYQDSDIVIEGTPYRPIRYINDSRFYGKVDLLDASTAIFGVWDEVRDGLRDGRYSKYSKSAGDYLIEGMGGFDEELAAPYLKRWATFGPISKGMFVTRRGIIPTKSAAINLNLKDKNVLINATPHWFENTKQNPKFPKEEDSISRKFKLRLPEGVNLPQNRIGSGSDEDLKKGKDIVQTQNGNFLLGERKPTKYNPAFDRRAENFPYMFQGKMYYYRWSGYSNEWTENPFPLISTRGIALYIAFLTATDVWYYAEGEQALKGHKFDYGVRGQNKFGYVNPLSGELVLQEN